MGIHFVLVIATKRKIILTKIIIETTLLSFLAEPTFAARWVHYFELRNSLFIISNNHY